MVALAAAPPPEDSSRPRPQLRVLVLHTYGGDWPGRLPFEISLEGAFSAKGVEAPVELFHETGEIYRFPDAAEAWREYLRAKYAQVRIDAIVAVWEPALAFLRLHRHDLFPGVPVVYIRRSGPDPGDQANDMTGLCLTPNLRRNAELIRQVLPSVRTLYVVDAVPENSGVVEGLARDQLAPLSWLTVRYLRDRPLDEVRSTLRSAPADSAVLFLRQAISEPGERLGQHSGVAAIVGASAVPVFATIDALLGLGVVGGHMWNTEENTAHIAATVRRIAEGARASTIEPVSPSARPKFDARALERWQISEGRLPAGAVVLFRRPGLWRDHRAAVLSTAAAFLALAILTTGLILQRDRRRKAEAERQRSEAQTSAMLRAIPDLMFVIRKDGVYLDYRARSDGELFVSPSYFLGKRVRDLWPVELAEPFERGLEKAMSSSEPVTIEYSLPMAGEERHYEARIVRRDDEAALTIVRDVTERYRAGERLHKAEEELSKSSRLGSLGELAAGIAHELNQPLAAAITNARTILRRTESDPQITPDIREGLQDIVADGRRAAEILSRIIGSIKPESVKWATLSLNDLAGDVAMLTRRTLLEKRVSLSLDLDPALSPVKGDRVQLQQVLMNFVLNAVDAMADSKGRPRDVTIRTGMDRGRVRLSVDDTGPGLASTDAERLFSRFFTTKPDHMGMGLSLCRRIAERHGGDVRLARNTPDGATFELEMPAA